MTTCVRTAVYGLVGSRASRGPAGAKAATRRAGGVGQLMFGSNGTGVHAEHPSSRALYSILLPLGPRREWTADSFSSSSPCRLLPARMLSWCPALGTKKRRPGVDTTVDPHYSRYMSNTNRIAAGILASPSHALFGAWLASLCFALGCAAN